MAEYLLHETNEPHSYVGAMYRDGTHAFHAFGTYANSCYDDNGELIGIGKRLAEGNRPLRVYAKTGTFSDDRLTWERNATAKDLAWLASLNYGWPRSPGE